jgi:hypothetical protein
MTVMTILVTAIIFSSSEVAVLTAVTIYCTAVATLSTVSRDEPEAHGACECCCADFGRTGACSFSPFIVPRSACWFAEGAEAVIAVAHLPLRGITAYCCCAGEYWGCVPGGKDCQLESSSWGFVPLYCGRITPLRGCSYDSSNGAGFLSLQVCSCSTGGLNFP